MKIVLDTNILVAAYFNPHSFSAKILELADKNTIQIYWSIPLYKEAKQILGFLPPKDRKKILARVFKPEFRVSTLPRIEVVKEDPEDNKILACALGGKVDLVVSNDRHLLEIGEIQGVKILSSKEAYKLLAPPKN